MNAQPIQPENLDSLIRAWHMNKAAEQQFHDDRLYIEALILDLVGTKPTGSEKLDGLTIQFGIDRKWDQAKLNELRPTVKAEYWPFKIEWKEDKKASDYIENKFPGLWEKIKTALVTRPKKPAFSMTKDKE